MNAPFHPLPLDQPAPASGSSTTDGWPHWSILVVDDEQGMLNFLVKTLAPRCHFVMSAGSAEEGAEWLRGHHADLVILDISLPGMDGYEVLEVLRNTTATRDTPIFALSANAMQRDIEKGLAAGFDDYLTKPIDVARLLSTIDALLERRVAA